MCVSWSLAALSTGWNVRHTVNAEDRSEPIPTTKSWLCSSTQFAGQKALQQIKVEHWYFYGTSLEGVFGVDYMCI